MLQSKTQSQIQSPSRHFAEVSQSSAKARFGKGKGFPPPHARARSCSVAASSIPSPRNGGFGMKREELLEKVDDALANLEQALANGHSEQLQKFLEFTSRFHNYSFGNVLLICMQFPEATMIAGYQTWKKMGRQVKKGEKGIRILAPMIYKKKSEEGEEGEFKSEEVTKDGKRVAGFRAVSVFDVSQTDGEELPTIRGYTGNPAENLFKLEEFVASKGIELLYEDPGSGALGVSQDGRILVKPDMEPAETFAVLAHEVAHELLHKGDRRKETTKTIRETEAEAVAYAVCSAVGLQAGSGASDYIQLYQGDVEKLRESLELIRKTASEILGMLEISGEPVSA